MLYEPGIILVLTHTLASQHKLPGPPPNVILLTCTRLSEYIYMEIGIIYSVPGLLLKFPSAALLPHNSIDPGNNRRALRY